MFIAGWSSQVARWAHNPKVTGSNPVPATKFSGDVAQLAERLICIQEVAGSTPVISTIFKLRFRIGNFKPVKDKILNPST
jgi:hypothetical protein